MGKGTQGYRRQPSAQRPRRKWIDPSTMVDMILGAFSGTNRPESDGSLTRRRPSARSQRSDEQVARLKERAERKRQRKAEKLRKDWAEYLSTYYAADKLVRRGDDHTAVEGSA